MPSFVVDHDALAGLAGDEAFEAPDDVYFGKTLGGVAGDVGANATLPELCQLSRPQI